MKKSKYGYAGLKVLLLLMCVPMGLWAQLRVTLVDAQRHPVVDATEVLLRADSTCAGAALSAPDGSFAFSEVPTHGRLIIQHLQYQTLQLPTDVAVPDTLQLELKGRSLDEVVVKAERPLVQVADGKLCYRLPSLVERQAVSNVYEALAKVPGVWQDGSGQLSLAGTGSLTLMLDGRPTTMSAEQLQTLLRSMSVNQVERVEVMYSAPPELHVRGAVLNVVTKRPPRQSFQGEVGADYKNQYFNSGGTHANFRFSSPRTTVDVMYSANCVKKSGIYRAFRTSYPAGGCVRHPAGRAPEFPLLGPSGARLPGLSAEAQEQHQCGLYEKFRPRRRQSQSGPRQFPAV